MSSERLLERLLFADEHLGNRSSLQTLKDSIRVHLTGLLNTRQGSAPIDPHYGIPDLSNVAGSFAVGSSEAIVASIIDAINRYEPRLLLPQIKSLKEEKEVISLKYLLTGYIEPDQGERQILHFFVKINSSGRISLEEQRGA